MENSAEHQIFNNYQMGSTPLMNRIVMAPMTRCRATNNIPNELMATYYSQRAGAGLIITEGTSPSVNGIGYARIPGIYSEEQIEGWKKVVDQVHQLGGKIFIQLMHCGRVAHPANIPSGGEILAPSAVILNEKMYVDGKGMQDMPMPKAMSEKEILSTIKEYRQAAANAIKAGFDGVELHGANGYLINQFLNPASNHRTDEYGGSIENRTRFALEVAQEVVAEIGSSKTGIRLSPHGVFNGMELYDNIDETYIYLVTQLNRLGLSYIHLVDHSSMGAPEVPVDLKRQIRTIFNNTLILSGGYDKERAEKDIAEGAADLIALGRPYIANPDLVARLSENAKLTPPKEDSFYTPGAEGYVDYPYLKVEP